MVQSQTPLEKVLSEKEKFQRLEFSTSKVYLGENQNLKLILMMKPLIIRK